MVAAMQPALAERLRELPLTYPEVGATAGELPEGYVVVRRTEVVGRGGAHFRDAADALLSWRMHERAGLRVRASSPVAEPGTLVVLGFGLGPLRVPAACRVVSTVRRDRTAGFAYGTLQGHPEAGEASFLVEHQTDDTVTLSIVTFARPARWFTRLGGWLSAAVARRVTDRYVAAMRRI